jgi:hypothetical protein
MKKRQYFAVEFANKDTKIMCAEDIYELMHNLTIMHDVWDNEVVSIRRASSDEQIGYQFDDFVEYLNGTLARLHSIEDCDNDYCVSFDDNDVQSVLACTFATMLKIDYDNKTHEYVVNREELFEAFKEDKYAMKNLLDTFNTIMNRFNVVVNHEHSHNYKVTLR